jgi:acyl-CoA thioesterase-1
MRSDSTVFELDALEDRRLLAVGAVHINFQPSKAPVPPGYMADVGWSYRKRGALRFGWNATNTRSAVDRNSSKSPDQRYDTFNAMQVGTKNYSWSIALPNGVYQVHLSAGDAKVAKGNYRIKANSTIIINGKPTAKNPFVEGTGLVSVKNGKLVLAIVRGAINDKIDYVDIAPVQASTQVFQAERASATNGTQTSGSAITSLDPGDWIEYTNVRFTGVNRSIQVKLAVPDAQAGQQIEFHLDAPDGQLIGTLVTDGNGPGADFITQSAAITTNPKGVHDLYVVFKGSSAVGSMDAFRFSNEPFLTIMPLGDSITEGQGNANGNTPRETWRRPLWQMLEDGGYSVDFSGTHHGLRPTSGDPTHFDFDLDNEAHSGFRADMIKDQLPGWLNQAGAPDIVLMHLGTNDFMAGQSVSSTVADIGGIIDELRAANPNVTILLAQIIPADYPQINNADITAFNAALPDLVSQKQESGSQIVLVDQNTGFDATTDTVDGIHPTPAGEEQMAQRWFTALKPFL